MECFRAYSEWDHVQLAVNFNESLIRDNALGVGVVLFIRIWICHVMRLFHTDIRTRKLNVVSKLFNLPSCLVFYSYFVMVVLYFAYFLNEFNRVAYRVGVWLEIFYSSSLVLSLRSSPLLPRDSRTPRPPSSGGRACTGLCFTITSIRAIAFWASQISAVLWPLRCFFRNLYTTRVF